MSTYPRAQVVPFSSVVGSSVTLHEPEGRVIGQLAILNTGGDTKDDWKRRQTAVAEDTAKRINLHDDLVAVAREAKTLAAMAVMSDDEDGSPSEDQVALDKLRARIDAVLAKAEAS